MQFSRGDLITATGLDAVNGQNVRNAISLGDQGFHGWQDFYKYFYSTQASKQHMVSVGGHCGWDGGIWVAVDKWENGNWVQKDKKGHSTGWSNWEWDLGGFNSFGPGYYRVRLSIAKWHWCEINITNGMTACVRGALLKMVSSLAITDSKVDVAFPKELITAQALNEGRVYTLENV